MGKLRQGDARLTVGTEGRWESAPQALPCINLSQWGDPHWGCMLHPLPTASQPSLEVEPWHGEGAVYTEQMESIKTKGTGPASIYSPSQALKHSFTHPWLLRERKPTAAGMSMRVPKAELRRAVPERCGLSQPGQELRARTSRSAHPTRDHRRCPPRSQPEKLPVPRPRSPPGGPGHAWVPPAELQCAPTILQRARITSAMQWGGSQLCRPRDARSMQTPRSAGCVPEKGLSWPCMQQDEKGFGRQHRGPGHSPCKLNQRHFSDREEISLFPVSFFPFDLLKTSFFLNK